MMQISFCGCIIGYYLFSKIMLVTYLHAFTWIVTLTHFKFFLFSFSFWWGIWDSKRVENHITKKKIIYLISIEFFIIAEVATDDITSTLKKNAQDKILKFEIMFHCKIWDIKYNIIVNVLFSINNIILSNIWTNKSVYWSCSEIA